MTFPHDRWRFWVVLLSLSSLLSFFALWSGHVHAAQGTVQRECHVCLLGATGPFLTQGSPPAFVPLAPVAQLLLPSPHHPPTRQHTTATSRSPPALSSQ